jgi:nitrite reductase/ring-hydroxylating ferredoxin subunit
LQQVKIRITNSASLSEGGSFVFSFRDESGFLMEGFVFRRNARLYAYRNQCRHQPLSLDYGDNEFFTEDAAYLLCRNHGALFVPETGKCVSGPCLKATLLSLEVIEENGDIFLMPPSLDSMPDLE